MHKLCRHCHTSLSSAQMQAGFCCLGCSSAFAFVNELGLTKFYEVLDRTEINPAATHSDNMTSLFDVDEFQSNFCEDRPGGRRIANLYIGGLSCYACVWLVEHALSSKFNDLECSISLSQGSLRLTWNSKDTNLSDIVRLIRNLGFVISPSPDDFARSNAHELIRLGVTTFCFLNVMLVSVPDYIDADLVDDVKFWWLFRLMSLAFAAVVISFGSWPFYRKAYVALTQRRVSIDQSISIAVIATFVFSTVNVFKGSGPIFFDSVCAIVALLGWGRYLQMRVMQSAEQSIRGLYDYTMQYVRIEEKIVPLTEIIKNNLFYVLPGDPIPVDATVVSGSGNISSELISGESDPTAVQTGCQIRGGSLNLTTRLDLRADQSGADSFIHKSSQAISNVLLDRGRMSTLSDRLGAGFFGIVLFIAGGILVFHWGDSPVEAVTRAIAAILIACPCAFAVAVPLTMARCAQIGLQRGVIFKNQHAIEKLGRVKEVLFDKTGTLTRGNPEVTHCEWAPTADERLIKNYLQLLPNYSNHHAIRAIAEWATRDSERSQSILSNFEETVGQGVQFDAGNRHWKLGRAVWCGQNEGDLLLMADGERIANFTLGDVPFPDSHGTVRDLRQRGLLVGLVSGDRLEKVTSLARLLGIEEKRVFAEQSPDDKVIRVQNHSGGLRAMVGNGFNDSLAMAYSDVGVAVAEATQQVKDSADVCLLTTGTSAFVSALELSEQAKNKIYASFVFAIIFNLSGLSLAAAGHMHPVVAAILMPISSLSVIAISIRWKLRQKAQNLR